MMTVRSPLPIEEQGNLFVLVGANNSICLYQKGTSKLNVFLFSGANNDTKNLIKGVSNVIMPLQIIWRCIYGTKCYAGADPLE